MRSGQRLSVRTVEAYRESGGMFYRGPVKQTDYAAWRNRVAVQHCRIRVITIPLANPKTSKNPGR